MRKSVYLAVVILLMIVEIGFPTHATPSVNLSSGFTNTPPSIDGVLQSGEWSSSGSMSFRMNQEHFTGTIFVMNDASNIYIAVAINDTSLANRLLQIFFDDNSTGTIVVGDDALIYRTDLAPAFDGYFASASSTGLGIGLDVNAGGTNDGSAVATSNGSVNIFEFSHPLCSADRAHDFCLHRGGLVAFDLNYAMPGNGRGGRQGVGYWPEVLTSNNLIDSSTYARLTIA